MHQLADVHRGEAGGLVLRGQRGYILVAAVVIPACLAYTAGLAFKSRDDRPTGSQPVPFVRQPVDVFDRELPLLVPGQEVDPADVEAAAGYRVVDPGGWTEQEARSRQVWYSEATGEVGVRYGDTIVILYKPWGGDEDPSRVYERQMESTGFGEIFPAPQGSGWLVPGTPESHGLTSATFTLDGVEIVVLTLEPPDRALEIAKQFSGAHDDTE